MGLDEIMQKQIALAINKLQTETNPKKMKKFIEDLIVTTEMVSLEHEIKDFLIENNEKEDENDK